MTVDERRRYRKLRFCRTPKICGRERATDFHIFPAGPPSSVSILSQAYGGKPGPNARRRPSSSQKSSAVTLFYWNNHRPSAVILYTGPASNNDRVGYVPVDEDVSERRLETIEIVREERVVSRDSSVLINHRERSPAAASNPVVQHCVAVSEAPDLDSCAASAKNGALRRRHSDIVV